MHMIYVCSDFEDNINTQSVLNTIGRKQEQFLEVDLNNVDLPGLLGDEFWADPPE